MGHATQTAAKPPTQGLKLCPKCRRKSWKGLLQTPAMDAEHWLSSLLYLESLGGRFQVPQP